MANTYNLFLSHSWNYGDSYDRLVGLLDARSYFFYKNYSVPKNDPIHGATSDRALEAAIKAQISSCHVVIIMAGVYSTYSKWINKEIAIARRGFATPKPIIAVRPRGNMKVSTTVTAAADALVNWNTESIVAAIRRLG